MKEDNGEQGIGATAFDLSNSQNPTPHAKPFYGSTHVPHPTNSAAKRVNGAEIMDQVINAR